ncbi:MAG: glycosyltransferase family 2 protein [Bacillota bacterium]
MFEIIFQFITLIIFVGFVLSIISTIYYFALTIAGGFKKKPEDPRNFPATNRFAVVIAAHNEDMVIESTIESLINIDYPKELIDIYLIADNCTDKTAEIARKMLCNVLERNNLEKKGKGHALTWGFEKIWATNIKYDAVCLFDADNLVDKSYFLEMNKSLHQGHNVIQGYIGCKNPEDSWVSACYSINFWLANRFFQLSRFQLGLSCGIGGTGFVVRTELLKEIGWDSYCLTEDLEFQLKLVERNMKVAWNHDAIFYDEKPITLKQSIKQRTRWVQGYTDCITRFFGIFMRKTIKEKSIIALDTAFFMIQSYWMGAIWVSAILSALLSIIMGFYFPLYWTGLGISIGVLESTMLLLGLFLLYEKKLTPKIFLYLLTFPYFSYTWLIPIVLGWKRRKDNAWVHTEHTRSIDIKDML